MAWPFLIDILQAKGIGPRWRAWIAMILFTAPSSVLLNGAPGPPISHARGLHQGDTLFSMLFNIIMDALNLMITKAEDGL